MNSWGRQAPTVPLHHPKPMGLVTLTLRPRSFELLMPISANVFYVFPVAFGAWFFLLESRSHPYALNAARYAACDGFQPTADIEISSVITNYQLHRLPYSLHISMAGHVPQFSAPRRW